jgi:hypothetical protein
MKSLAVAPIPISQQIAGRAIPRECFEQLVSHPFSRGVLRDGNVDGPTPIVRQNHEDKQHPELRHAYHSNARIFAATSDCIDLRWESPSKLVIACRGSTVDSADIDVQKRQSGNIAVSYENIAIRGSLTSEKWNRITQEIYDFAALFDSLEGEGKAA